MNFLLLISIVLIVYYGVMIARHPHNWSLYLPILPIIIFMTYARLYGMNEQAWRGAFEISGLVALIVIALLWQQDIVMDRITLGLNIFLIVGAAGFLFNIEQILEWYSNSKGGPIFGSIATIGIITTLFNKRSFIGVLSKKKEAVIYSSFLLLATTFIMLVWSVTTDDQGLLYSVVLPLVILYFIRNQLQRHL